MWCGGQHVKQNCTVAHALQPPCFLTPEKALFIPEKAGWRASLVVNGQDSYKTSMDNDGGSAATAHPAILHIPARLPTNNLKHCM